MSAVASVPASRSVVNKSLLTTVLIAAVGSVLAVQIVAAIGRALGVVQVMQLGAGPLSVFTVFGVAIGTFVWARICRRAAAPKQLLSRLVPAVLVASFIPDILLGVAGTAWSAVLALMCAHLAVFAVTIPVLAKRIPPRTQVSG